jgi:type II secretory pathway pseudopilin PulG
VGFTLVELLVVIGIITALIAILLPAASKVHQQSQRVKCAAHLNQIGTAAMMYSADWRGYLPMGKVFPAPGRPRGYFWFEHIAPYVQRQVDRFEIVKERHRSVLWGCPAWEADEFQTWAVGYVYNEHPLLPGGTRLIDCMWRESGVDGRYFKITQIPNRTERAMVADGYHDMAHVGPWRPHDPLTQQHYGNISPMRHGHLGGSTSVNVLFFAGHVRGISGKEAVYAFADPLWTRP